MNGQGSQARRKAAFEGGISTAEIARLKVELAHERAAKERFRAAAESTTNLIYEWDLGDRMDWFGRVDDSSAITRSGSRGRWRPG